MSDKVEGENFAGTDIREDTGRLIAELSDLANAVGQLQSVVNSLATQIGNLVGDEDLTPGNGYIEVDRSAASHPVIRFRGERLISSQTNRGVFTPFYIYYDQKSAEWKIYVPPGCVRIGGHSYEIAYYEGVTDSSDMAVISPAPTLYAHVRLNDGGSYSFTIDGSVNDSSDRWVMTFAVASFSSNLSEVVVQYVNNAMILFDDEYVCGDDSNIVIQRCNDPDDIDRFGKMVIDVYYV